MTRTRFHRPRSQSISHIGGIILASSDLICVARPYPACLSVARNDSVRSVLHINIKQGLLQQRAHREQLTWKHLGVIDGWLLRPRPHPHLIFQLEYVFLEGSIVGGVHTVRMLCIHTLYLVVQSLINNDIYYRSDSENAPLPPKP